MKLICVVLAATLAVTAAKPYGVKGGHDRDNEHSVQSHIPVNEDFNADRLELSQTRKIGQPVRPSYGGGSIIQGRPLDREPIIQGRPLDREHIIQGRPLDREPIIQGRPLDREHIIQGRPLDREPIIQGRPLDREHIIQGRPLDREPIIQGRPLEGGYRDREIIQGRPIGGIHSSRLETEELSGQNGVHGAQQIGGIKGGQQRQIGY